MDARSRPFFTHLTNPALVLLGDPGIGKTTEFKRVADAEIDSEFISANDFLSLALRRFKGKTLYIDALDEQRAQSKSGVEVLNQIRKRLDKLGCPRFRLSCRMADWYGTVDAEDLAKVSPDGSLVVLKLDSLTDQDIAIAITDVVSVPTKFIAEARKRGLDDLLLNPQSLKLLTDAVQADRWPSTRQETFEMAIAELAREVSAKHSKSDYGDHSSEAIIDSAGQICVAIMCSNANGVSLSAATSDIRFPWLQDVFGPDRVFQAAARRRFFTVHNEHVTPVHRTVAEYLAARYLARRLREGASPQRIISMLTGPTGETTSDLRGLFAWIPCLCPEHAETFIRIDPLGIVLYGDAAGMTASQKRALFDSFSSLAQKDPWFRTSDWTSEPFGALGTPDMSKSLCDILDKPDVDPEVKSCTLDAIRHGSPMPELGDSLLKFIRSGNGSRVQAVMAFCHACPDRLGELRNLLDDIVAGKAPDPDRRLRSTILRQIYPRHMSVDKIVDYLVVDDPDRDPVNDYSLEAILLEKSTDDDAVRLLDSVLLCAKREKMASHYSWQRFVSKLLWRVIKSRGDNVSPEQLYQWLGAGMDRSSHNWVRDKEAKEIKQWLEARPDLYEQFFMYWLGTLQGKGVSWLSHAFFTHRLLEARRPPGFWRILLAKVSEFGIDRKLAELLFCLAVNDCFYPTSVDGPSLDDLFAYVDRRPDFKDLLISLCKCEVDDTRWEHINKRSEWARERIKAKEDRIKDLLPRIQRIREGRDWGALFFFGQVYFHPIEENSKEKTPWERIESAATSDLTQAAFEGLRAVVCRDAFLSPTQVGTMAAKLKPYKASHVVLAGMNILANENSDINALVPDSMAELAVAFHLYNSIGEGDAIWFRPLIASRPKVVAKSMLDYFRPQMKKKGHIISGLYSLINEPAIQDVARIIVPTLLRAYPAAQPQTLNTLLHSALIHCPREELSELVAETMSRRGSVVGVQRLMWETVGLMMGDVKKKAVKFSAQPSVKNVKVALDLFMLPREHHSHVSLNLPLASITSMISFAGRVCRPRETFVSGFVSSSDEIARHIGQLLDMAGGSGDEGTSASLSSLIKNQALKHWRNHLMHARAICVRKAGETNFKPPSAASVVRALSRGPPVNISDLRAIVLDALNDLQRDLLDGASDGYEAFWSVDSHGRPMRNAPKPENTCRNRIVERLSDRLKPMGIRIDREKSHARGKRSDIAVSCGRMSLPIEIKLQHHPALWTALKNQLVDAYVRDPDASGHGIYLVIYHGKHGSPMTAPPKGSLIPLTATDLGVALANFVPDESKPYVSVQTLDVSLKLKTVKASGGKTRQKVTLA